MENKWIRGALPAVLIHISIGSVYAWSLFVKLISDYIGQSQSKVQFAFSLAIFFLGMSAAFGGNIVEKNIKKSSLISCICFCTGLLLTAFAIYLKSLILIYLGYGCLMGIGLGTGYITPVKTLMIWFKDKKGLATGISVCAFGFASSVASPIITYLTNKFSLITTFIILSCIYFVPMIIAHFIIKKPNYWSEPSKDNDNFRLMSMWKKKEFIFLWLVIFINITCGLALISTASPIMNEQKFNTKLIAIVVSIMGIFNGCGRLVFSAFSDKLKNRITIYHIILSISMFITFFTLIVPNKITIPISLMLISACYGAGFSCLPTLLSDMYDMKYISRIHGLSLTAWAIAGLCGNQLSSLVHIITDSYINVYLILFVLYTLAQFCALNVVSNKSNET